VNPAPLSDYPGEEAHIERQVEILQRQFFEDHDRFRRDAVQGYYALRLAIDRHTHPAVLQSLLDLGACPDIPPEAFGEYWDQSPLAACLGVFGISLMHDRETRASKVGSPLRAAIEERNFIKTKLLLDHGADLADIDFIPMHYANFLKSRPLTTGGLTDTVWRLLLSRGLNLGHTRPWAA
jgi:hypothetical protein